MTRDEETLFIRFLQEAEKKALKEHLTLTKKEMRDGKTHLYFCVVKGQDSGYLWLDYNDDGSILAAEMNVNFPTMIGLNRSPLELRILAEHVQALFKDDDVQAENKDSDNKTTVE